jgi:hypothetical protein
MDDDSLELLANLRYVKKPVVVKPIKEKKIMDENDEIIELLHTRLKLEKNKYGISLKQNVFDDRSNIDWELMALEEMLDGLIYTATTIIRYKRKKTKEISKLSVYTTDTNDTNDTTDTKVINIDNTSVDNTSVDNTSVNNTSIDNTSVNNTSVDNTSVDNTSVDNTSVDNTSVDNTSVDNTSVREGIKKNNISKTNITSEDDIKIIRNRLR